MIKILIAWCSILITILIMTLAIKSRMENVGKESLKTMSTIETTIFTLPLVASFEYGDYIIISNVTFYSLKIVCVDIRPDLEGVEMARKFLASIDTCEIR